MLDRMALITAIGDSVNRMIPPLIVTKKQIDELMLIMRRLSKMQLQNTNSDNTTILIHKTTFKKRLPAIMLAASYVLYFFFIRNGLGNLCIPVVFNVRK